MLLSSAYGDSRHGLHRLHGNFIHTGSKAALILTTMESTRIEVHGQIVRCRHVRDRVHDIGMKFDVPVDLTHLVSQPADADADEQTGLDLPQFTGRVLYVDDQIEEQRLLKFHLESLGVELVLATTGDEALHTVDRQRFDAVFSVLVLTDMTGPDLFEALKSNGYSRPIVAMSANDDPNTQSEIVDHGCSAFLAKPYTIEQLADVLKDVLPSADADGAGGLLSTEWHNERMRPLIRQYLDKLQEHVVELTTAIEQQGEMNLIQKLCLDIKGSSGSYGFPQISENAATIHQALADQDAGPVESIVRELIDPALKELRNLCDAAHRSVASV